MEDPVSNILAHLHGVRQTSQTQWEARCPGHDDQRASLSISVGEDGRALLHCHAGCSNVSIVRSLGMRLADLFPDRRLPGNAMGRREGRIVAEYDYRDAAGELLFQVVRMEPKDFRQRRPDGSGGWVWELGDTPRVLYRLPELLVADPASWFFCCEGERDVDNLVALGLTATCNPGGAGKWSKLSDDSALHGRKVAILPDKDAPGHTHAVSVAEKLLGMAKSVRIVPLPGEGKDVSDWLAAGGTAQQLLALVEQSAAYEPAGYRHLEDAAELPGGVYKLDLFGNADRFMHMFGQDVHWCEARGRWFVWDGRSWREDAIREVNRMAELTMRAMLTELADDEDGLKWAIKCNRDAKPAREMLEVAKHRTAIEIKDMDNHPWLLGARNGIVDLRTGELLAHDRKYLITKLCSTEYLPDAQCPRWEQFLLEIMAGNADMVAALQRLSGYLASGDISVQILPIFYGPGGNGKNVMLDSLMGILGPHAEEAPDGLVTAKATDEHPTEIADLYGKRLIVASETEENKKLRIGLVKKITGNKYLKGRFMRQDYFQFERTHKTVLVTNNKPVVTEVSNAIWRRLRLIPFLVTIPECKQDRQLTEKLMAEWPGILAWAIRGCLDWQARQCNLEFPQAVHEATEEYRNDSDHVADFVAERCTDWRQFPEQRMRILKEHLYGAYCAWCRNIGEDVLSRTAFNRRMQSQGFIDKKVKENGKTPKYWMDLTLEGNADA